MFVNDKGQYEILDGQQRLLTIRQYLEGKIDLSHTEIPPYSDLSTQERALLDAYCVFYLKLKSHDPDSKEEDIVQTFLRLQEGTPLNKAEKINAYRGRFKDEFRKARDTLPIFGLLGPEKRFRLRQLAAELLTLELEGDYKNIVFPDLDLKTMVSVAKKYEKDISEKKVKYFHGNLEYLYNSLNLLISGFKPAEIISFYLLTSFLRRDKADNSDLINELAAFAKDFLQNLNAFSMYDTKPPKGMDRSTFDTYLKYKLLAKKMTLADSIKERFILLLTEYKRLKPYIEKDQDRLHDIEQKRILYFRQRGLCQVCGKQMLFQTSSSHHVIAHSEGGHTDDLTQAMLIHERCHKRIEKAKKKAKRKS